MMKATEHPYCRECVHNMPVAAGVWCNLFEYSPVRRCSQRSYMSVFQITPPSSDLVRFLDRINKGLTNAS